MQTDSDAVETVFVDTYNKEVLKVTPQDLERMTDSELALWHSRYVATEARERLAAYEWQRRLAARQLEERFGLDEKLHRTNRWWQIVTAAIGVTAAIAGATTGAFMNNLLAQQRESALPICRGAVQSEAQKTASPQTPAGSAAPSIPSSKSPTSGTSDLSSGVSKP